jgi:hypothetical protein
MAKQGAAVQSILDNEPVSLRYDPRTKIVHHPTIRESPGIGLREIWYIRQTKGMRFA